MSDSETGMSVKAEDKREFFPPVETHLIPSKFVKQTFQVQVMRPSRKAGEAARYPVVYITDANFAFDVLKGISYSMQAGACNPPRFILVGIGYPSDCPLAGLVLRARDLTCPSYPKF